MTGKSRVHKKKAKVSVALPSCPIDGAEVPYFRRAPPEFGQEFFTTCPTHGFIALRGAPKGGPAAVDHLPGFWRIRVYLDGVMTSKKKPFVEGWTDGSLWNGWECPQFTKRQADAVLRAWNKGNEGPKAWYDAEKDAYVFSFVEQPDMPDIYEGHDWNGLKTYAIGSWYWTWSEWPRDG